MDEVSQTPGDCTVIICDQCGTSFPNKYQLTIHQRIHQGKEICECQYCYKYFLNKSHLRVHERSHTGERPYKCDQCGKYFKTGGYLNLHKRIRCLKKQIRRRAGQKAYKCDQCGAELASSHKLRIHLQIHRGKEIHKCRYCGKFCLFISELERHERFHTREQPYGCDQCGMKFSLKAPLDQHKQMYCLKKTKKCRRKPNISCSNLILKEETYESDASETKVEKLYKCEKCGDVFTRLWDLQRHWKLHAGEGTNEPLTLTCDKCGKVYTKLWGLQKHRKLHNAERPNVSNSNLIELKEETSCSNEGEDEKVLAKQTHEKPYTCDQCGKVFTRECDLQRHLELHTKERPNISSSNLIIPKEEPHDGDFGRQTDGKLCTCDQCGKVFTGQGDLQRHWELHNTERPNISTPNLVLKKETCDNDRGEKAIAKENKEMSFLCKDCGIVVRVQCTNLENVLSLTNPSNVNCFIEKHTLLAQ